MIRHSDGNLIPIIEYLLDSGIDRLHPIQPEAGMNIAEFKRKYGHRVTVVGERAVERRAFVFSVESNLPIAAAISFSTVVAMCNVLGSQSSLEDGLK